MGFSSNQFVEDKVETVSLGNCVSLELVWIPSGTFQMGSEDGVGDEKPVHPVELDGFWLGKYAVTQAQYEKVMGQNPSNFKHPQNPVETVSWDDSVAFCQKLSGKTGKTFRLPTEAEWEYACRAGSTGNWCFGDSEIQLGDYAWYNGNSGNQTHPVGEKKPNEWGLYDTHGNVWEWCEDWYGNYDASASKNPKGAASGSRRVGRGGGWYCDPRHCRSANRSIAPDWRIGTVGFRVLAVPEAGK